MNRLPSYEINFEKEIRRIVLPLRQKAGALLPVIPDRVNWDDFLTAVKAEWKTWRSNLGQCAYCLAVLYGGLAFYEYDENTFWPHFAKAIGSESLPANQQTEINLAFSNVVERLGLKLQRRENRMDFVGSAIYHIGIPLSLWDGFLEICEWALWQDNWKGLSDMEWADAIARRAGGRKRLKTFLIGNRQAASEIIQEMHDAREILRKERLSISELKQACLLRPEYFDEVPETAEFLCPQNPEALFKDRARLVWKDRGCISLYLPGVARDKLPATWHIGNLPPQKASATPVELVLNSAAFESSLLLRLESGQQSEVRRLRGVEPWGLFDMEREGRLVTNPDRDYLPLRSYALISPKKVDSILREGFEQEENPENQPCELENGTICYVTHLYPTEKYAKLSLTHVDKKWKLDFRTKSDIKPWFFVGKDKHAANFEVIGDMTKIERLPILCVAIPRGYLQHMGSNFHSKFRVLVDNMSANGEWETRDILHGDDRDFYFWKWAKTPFIKKVKSGIFHDFKEISCIFKPLNIRGEKVITITAPEHDPFKYKIYLEDPKYNIDECWKNLPGAFLPWFLLCQYPDGMTWDDLLLARDVIAPDSKISYNVIRKYADHGLLKRIGRKWIIAESRVVLTRKTGEYEVKFCGDPSILWGLYRKMYHVLPNHKLPMIEVVSKRGDLPFLLMRWNQFYPELDKYLKDHHVRPVSDLWRC